MALIDEPVPFTRYDRDILERLSWRLYHALQMHPSFSAQLSSGVTLAESIPLVTQLIGILDSQTAQNQLLLEIRADVKAIKAKVGA